MHGFIELCVIVFACICVFFAMMLLDGCSHKKQIMKNCEVAEQAGYYICEQI